MREGSLDTRDIVACNGNIPVWVFQHPAFRTTPVGARQMSHMLRTFTEEMSIDSLAGLYMVELHLDYQPPKGYAHNGSSLACVVPCIQLSNVASICRIKAVDWYFYAIDVIANFRKDILFPSSVQFTKEAYEADNTPLIKLSDFKSAAEYYEST